MTSLKLSSNDSMIIMEDADIGLAIDNLMKVGAFNCGQGGASPKKIIIHEKLYE